MTAYVNVDYPTSMATVHQSSFLALTYPRARSLKTAIGALSRPAVRP